MPYIKVATYYIHYETCTIKPQQKQYVRHRLVTFQALHRDFLSKNRLFDAEIQAEEGFIEIDRRNLIGDCFEVGVDYSGARFEEGAG